MTRVLFAWQLGGGLGHLGRMGPLMRGLAGSGHRLFAALQDLSRVRKVFGGIEVALLQAPFKASPARQRIDNPRTFADILHGTGFEDADELAALAEAWRHLYDFVRPDLIVFDHSPIALLAARGLQVRRLVIGNGFGCPEDVSPLPDLRPWLPPQAEQDHRESRVLANANRAIQGWKAQPLDRVSQLYSEVDETLLLTVRELDHYPQRFEGRYYGGWAGMAGKRPEWPAGNHPRVFAYLKPFPALPNLLKILNRLGCPTLAYVDGVGEHFRREFSSSTLRVEESPLDLSVVARECDFAILNGTHGATLAMLLEGKPILQLPFFLEQAITGKNTNRIGAGLTASLTDAREICDRLRELMCCEHYARAARRFAARYAADTPKARTSRITQTVSSLLA